MGIMDNAGYFGETDLGGKASGSAATLSPDWVDLGSRTDQNGNLVYSDIGAGQTIYIVNVVTEAFASSDGGTSDCWLRAIAFFNTNTSGAPAMDNAHSPAGICGNAARSWILRTLAIGSKLVMPIGPAQSHQTIATTIGALQLRLGFEFTDALGGNADTITTGMFKSWLTTDPSLAAPATALGVVPNTYAAPIERAGES